MVAFSELESLVQMAQFTTEKIPPYRETNGTSKDSPDMVTLNELGDSTPEDNGDENAVFHTQGVVATINSGKRNIDREESSTNKPSQTNPRNTIHNGGIIDPMKLDEDKRDGLQHLTKTFESIRGHMAMAWNSAMVWVDNELIFARLNKLIAVAKDATDRVREATSRAKANTINRLKSIMSESDVTHPENPKEKSIAQTDIVQQPEVRPTYRGRPKPLTTEVDRLVPTMPDLEDVDMRFVY